MRNLVFKHLHYIFIVFQNIVFCSIQIMSTLLYFYFDNKKVKIISISIVISRAENFVHPSTFTQRQALKIKNNYMCLTFTIEVQILIKGTSHYTELALNCSIKIASIEESFKLLKHFLQIYFF